MPKYQCLSNQSQRKINLDTVSNVVSYTGPNYFERLKDLEVKIIEIDFETPVYDFKNETTYYYQAAFLKYFLMATEGGVWSDTDIVFVRPMDQIDFSGKHMVSNADPNQTNIGISFYTNEHLPKGFYYTGFLLSSGKNRFFSDLTTAVRQKISSANSYLSLDQYLFDELFPNIRSISEKYPEYAIYNIDQSSIYSYTWFELSDFYNKPYIFNTPLNDIKSYNFESGIIGYHWFGGDPLSDIYEKSIDAMIKPSGYSFKGFFPRLIDVYKKETDVSNQAFNERYLKSRKLKKISIVMSYYNRKPQLLTTLKTILKSRHRCYEIIIVDDGSEEKHRIEDLQSQFKFQLIRIEKAQKDYCNPCIPYNLAFKKATGQILLIQNPECCHVGDILTHVHNNLGANDYLTYSCLAMPSYAENNKLSAILFDQNKPLRSAWTEKEHLQIAEQIILPTVKNLQPYTWYNHPIHNPSKLHFMTAVYKSHIDQIGGFDETYKNGYCFDDNDFLRRIEYEIGLNTHIIPLVTKQHQFGMKLEYNVYSIHQYHDVSSPMHNYQLQESKRKYAINETLFKRKHNKILVDYLKNQLGNENANLVGYSHKNFTETTVKRLNKTSFVIQQSELNSTPVGFQVSIKLPKDIIYSADAKRYNFEEKMNNYYNHYNKVIKFKCQLINPLPQSLKNQTPYQVCIFNGARKHRLGVIDQSVKEYQYIGPITNNNWRIYICNTKNNNQVVNKLFYMVKDLKIYCQMDQLTIETLQPIWKYTKIPKIAFTYWAGPMSRLHYLSIKSLLKLNPDWRVILYQPIVEYVGQKTWKTNEHSIQYKGEDYRAQLSTLVGLEIINIDFEKLGFYNNVPEVFKSNYITYYHLSKTGGVWFDTDILFLRSLNSIDLSKNMVHGNSDSLEVVVSYDSKTTPTYFSTGILMSSSNNVFYQRILSELKKRYDPQIYMSATNLIYTQIFKTIQGIHQLYPDLHYADLGMDLFYPFRWNEMHTLFETNEGMNRITKKVIGIHWYNGSIITEKFLNSQNYESNVLINQIIKKYKI